MFALFASYTKRQEINWTWLVTGELCGLSAADMLVTGTRSAAKNADVATGHIAAVKPFYRTALWQDGCRTLSPRVDLIGYSKKN